MVITGKNKPTSGTKISGKYDAVIFKNFEVISIKFNCPLRGPKSPNPTGSGSLFGPNILLNIISIVDYLPKNIFGSIFKLLVPSLRPSGPKRKARSAAGKCFAFGLPSIGALWLTKARSFLARPPKFVAADGRRRRQCSNLL